VPNQNLNPNMTKSCPKNKEPTIKIFSFFACVQNFTPKKMSNAYGRGLRRKL
jgi:hypothetical protein